MPSPVRVLLVEEDVVSDFWMPEMDGLALATAVHERDPNLPALLCTGLSRDQSEADLGSTTDGHVRKRTGSDQYAEFASLIAGVARVSPRPTGATGSPSSRPAARPRSATGRRRTHTPT